MMEMLMRGGRVAMILLNSFDEYESIILDVFMRHGSSIFGYSLANFYTQYFPFKEFTRVKSKLLKRFFDLFDECEFVILDAF